MSYYEQLRRGSTPNLPANLLGVVYQTAIRFGGDDAFEWMSAVYVISTHTDMWQVFECIVRVGTPACFGQFERDVG
jgi:hypothetical protein